MDLPMLPPGRDEQWLTALREHAVLFQNTQEQIASVLSSAQMNVQDGQTVLRIVREGKTAFLLFSDTVREADLSREFYAAAAEIEDRWAEQIRILVSRLQDLQAG
jgi:hypothetical protein